MHRIFISYSRKNPLIVEAISGDLNALGHKVWHDKELRGGQRWWDEIVRRVRECDVLIFVLDEYSIISVACASEYNYAIALGKRILPVRITSEINASRLPKALSEFQCVDYEPDDQNAVQRLARALEYLRPAPRLADRPPKPPEMPHRHAVKIFPLMFQTIELTRTELSRAEQIDLLGELKEGLNDPDYSDQTRGLIQVLRSREDLSADVAKDIDKLLQDKSSPPASPRLRPAGREIDREQWDKDMATLESLKAQMKNIRANERAVSFRTKTNNLSSRYNRRLPPPPPNYLALALLSILCFWPLAIPAIVFAVRVNQQTAAGEHAEALLSSRKARMFGIIAVLAGVITSVAYVAFYIASVPLMAR